MDSLQQHHAHEQIVERALRSMSTGPWTTADLDEVQKAMDDDWCNAHAPDCTSSDILRWLESLNEDQREELLFQMNTTWNAGKDPWALG